MSKEAPINIPDRFLENSLVDLNPYKFFSIIDEDIQNKTSNHNEILSGFTQSHQNPILRKQVFDHSINLIQHHSLRTSPEKQTDISKNILSIIMLNQSDRSLQNVWQAMLDQKPQLDDPLENTLLSIGTASYGFYGIAFMPNKDEDYTKPPFNLISPAFNQWVNSNLENTKYKVSKFFNRYACIYSTSDTNKLITQIATSKFENQTQYNTTISLKKFKE